ncbi:signal peptidase [Pseudooceanicola sediminis]|uniref:Signal peptidase n=1 Tax=Pseudooceanicola sediminis TaxID=2211117 RepID=A0A399J073_9RHOB|nr:imelysin family protein [Pseudooceanicola sediminis]KAA2313863.1 imelysin family protein [Puniceibacterium sp. HSS470]RII38681.1 signal peptidase [Pseudooceanicola sediminis]|tara:strand:- start:50536 stop:51558 length:1023 start_codon:yes stop_codon:yes gene_type:complete
MRPTTLTARFLSAACLSAGLTWAALPAHAGLDEVIELHILPGTADFADATRRLSDAASADCRPDAVQSPYNAAFDAWMEISHLRFGPLEKNGRINAIAFWPDAKGFIGRSLGGLIADQDPIVNHPQDFGDVSVAARGLFALEMLLYDPQYADYDADSYTCRLVQAISVDLARMADGIDADWRTTQAPEMRSAGQDGNTTYLSRDEVTQALYTALLAGLEFTADQRIGRPLGTFDRPRPARAEARRSDRSLRNVVLSLEALRDLSGALADVAIPVTEAAFDTALAEAGELNDPVFAGVGDPTGRLKVEIVQQRIQAVRRAVEGEIGAALGVTAGFNSADGD